MNTIKETKSSNKKKATITATESTSTAATGANGIAPETSATSELAAASTSTGTGAPLPQTLASPPVTAQIPSPPTGFVPTTAASNRIAAPQKAELAVLPTAISELSGFAAYTVTFGQFAPPAGEVVTLLGVGGAWSNMRAAVAQWDAYCKVQEATAWAAIRLQLADLATPFSAALARNPSLATQLPSVVALLDVRKAVAKKGASTKAANKAAIANGEPPTHGAVGKARTRAKANALLAAANAAANGKGASNGAVTPAPATNGTTATHS